jgi:hypothetical protein
MIRVEHRSLPAGLSAVARRGERGDLTIVVSESLDPSHQRAAVRAALRAARRHDWRLGLLPLPALIFMSATRSALSNLGHSRLPLGKLGHFLRAHAVVTAFAATVAAGAVVAGVVVLGAPASHPSGALPGSPGYQLTPGTSQPTSSGGAHARTRSGAQGPSHVGATGPGVVAVVSPSSGPRPTGSPQPTASPQPSPSASTSSPPTASPSPSTSSAKPSPTPTPTPSSSPTGGSGGGRVCVKVLGIVICL